MDAMTDVERRQLKALMEMQDWTCGPGDAIVRALPYDDYCAAFASQWADIKRRNGVGLSPAAPPPPGHADAGQVGKERHFCLAGCNPRNGRWRFGTPTGDWCDTPTDTVPAGITLAHVLSEVAEKRMVELDPRTGQPIAPPPAPAWPRWFAWKNVDHKNGTHCVWRMESQTEGRYWYGGRDANAHQSTVAKLEADSRFIELTPETCPALAEARRAATTEQSKSKQESATVALPDQPRDAMEERAMQAWRSPEYVGFPGPVCMVKFAKAERAADAATIAALTAERDGLREKVATLAGQVKGYERRINGEAKKKSPRRGGEKRRKVRNGK